MWALGSSFVFALVLPLVSRATPAQAQESESGYVIEVGREEEIQALLRPHGLGREVANGYVLSGLSVEFTQIRARLRSELGAEAELVLSHPDAGHDDDAVEAGRSASFSVYVRSDDAEGRDAALVLMRAVQRNDGGGFFRLRAEEAEPTHERSRRGPTLHRSLARDGLLWSLVAVGLLLWLVGRQMPSLEVRERWILLAACAVGGILRAFIAPHTVLGAWPYARTTDLMHALWQSPTLAVLSGAFGPLSFLDVVTHASLVFAVLAPLAVFAHASSLLKSPRAGLLCALLVALLPNHIRFSHSEVAFIPSITLSSLTFALLHVALKDPSRRAATVAAVALPFALFATFVARPLNVLFLPLFVLVALVLSRKSATLARRAVTSILVVGVGAWAIVQHLLTRYATQVSEGTDLDLLVRAFEAFFSLEYNTLVNPWITPPGLLVLFGLGAWRTFREDRDTGLFLMGWLVAFFVTHAYVLAPAPMMARYHLHLVVPFVMLAAVGLLEVRQRWPRLVPWVAGYLLLSPLLHADFIGDVEFNDQAEYDFVSRAARELEPGCTVLEYLGDADSQAHARFARLGTRLTREGLETHAFEVVSLAETEHHGELRPEVLDLLSDPPACLVYYEGLTCFYAKDPHESIAGPCRAIREAALSTHLEGVRFDNRPYDQSLTRGFGTDLRQIELSLYRLRGRRGSSTDPPRP